MVWECASADTTRWPAPGRDLCSDAAVLIGHQDRAPLARAQASRRCSGYMYRCAERERWCWRWRRWRGTSRHRAPVQRTRPLGSSGGRLGDTYTYMRQDGVCRLLGQACRATLLTYIHMAAGVMAVLCCCVGGGSRVGTASVSLFVGTDAVVCWLLRCCKSTDRLRYHHLHLLCTWHLPPHLLACLPLAPPPPYHARLPPTSLPPRACSCSSCPLERSPLRPVAEVRYDLRRRRPPSPPPALRPPPLVTLARVLLALFCCACTTSLA